MTVKFFVIEEKPLNILFIENGANAGEPVCEKDRLRQQVAVDAADALEQLRKELDQRPDLNHFVVDLLLADQDQAPSAELGFEAVRLIRGQRRAPIISIWTTFDTPENRRRAEELDVFEFYCKGSDEGGYGALLAAHQREHDFAILSAPFSPEERKRNATYEWCLTDPQVQERYGGQVAVAFNKEVLGTGRTHPLAWQDAQQNHGDSCPSREEVVFVVVPGLPLLPSATQRGIAS